MGSLITLNSFQELEFMLPFLSGQARQVHVCFAQGLSGANFNACSEIFWLRFHTMGGSISHVDKSASLQTLIYDD